MERVPVPYAADNTIRLPAEPASAARARAFVRQALARTRHPDLEDAALLCVTELVANVSRHTESAECIITLRDDRSGVVIEVADNDDDHPEVSSRSGEAEHGRGLQIVDALAGEWGVTAAPDHGKSIWLKLIDRRPREQSGTGS